MPLESSVNDVFRFIQLRPKRAIDPDASLPLIADTSIAVAIAGTSGEQRMSLANRILESHKETVRSLDEVPFGPETAAAIAALRNDAGATTETLLERVPKLRDGGGEPGRRALSDTLLAAFYATTALPKDLRAMQDVYRVLTIVSAGATKPLGTLLRLPLLAPAPPPPTPSPVTRSDEKAGATQDDLAARLANAIAELAPLDRAELLVQPDDDGKEVDGRGKPFTLTAAARGGLSKETAALLAERKIDLATTTIDLALHLLMADRESCRRE